MPTAKIASKQALYTLKHLHAELAGNRVSHRQAERAMRERAIVEPPMVLKPSGMRGVGVQMPRADLVVLAANHSAQAREVRLGLIGADAIIKERDRVIDALRKAAYSFQERRVGFFTVF